MRAMAEPREHHHGNTPAAWTAAIIVMVAFLVSTVGLVVGSWVAFWVGVGLVVVGGVVGLVMQRMGLGQLPARG